MRSTICYVRDAEKAKEIGGNIVVIESEKLMPHL